MQYYLLIAGIFLFFLSIAFTMFTTWTKFSTHLNGVGIGMIISATI